MSQEEDLLSYDDDEAIKFILNCLPEEQIGRAHV